MPFSRTLVSWFFFSFGVQLIHLFLLTLLLTSFSLSTITSASDQLYPAPPANTATPSLLPSDAVSLLTFESKADLDHKLLYALNERYDYCSWQGVKCAQGRVVRFVLQDFGLRGTLAPDSLTRLDQLRVLSLCNNSLSGPIPDLSPLVDLKSLILDHNNFAGSFPLSVLSLHRLLTLHLSHNNLTGPIPVELNGLDRLISLRLESNHFNGPFPPLNLSLLRVFNVSSNNLTGAIPVTRTLGRFDASSFSWNPGLCGEIIHKDCRSGSPFFGSSNANSSSGGPLGQSAQGIMVVSSSNPEKHKSKSGVIVGFTIGVLLLIALLVCAFTFFRKHSNNRRQRIPEKMKTVPPPSEAYSAAATSVKPTGTEVKTADPLAKTTKTEEMERVHKSGKLVFCSSEPQLYTIEQLMKGSAELLGRGTIGITYKAVLDNQLIVTVKRLDAGKTAITSSDAFERHMETVGWLRHLNLVAVRAYFQAKGERLVIYDYQPNGSLFNLIHGSRSTRAKPLHWTSCLKIAEDVAQGLAYMHQASKLIHGNLKSSNVLLGVDFEACITDYSLAVLADSSSAEDSDSASYRGPETRKSSRHVTAKSDVYSFGVLLLELLTGKHPSKHPYLLPTDVLDWVRAMRDGDSAEDNQLGMLTEVASICSVTSPEQRPAMWQVLKMIQQIKESALMEEGDSSGGST